MAEEMNISAARPARLPRWWIFSGPILLAAIVTLVTLGVLYFLSHDCVKLTDTEMCFDCLQTRKRETLCLEYHDGDYVRYQSWFSYYRAPRVDECDSRDPRQDACRPR